MTDTTPSSGIAETALQNRRRWLLRAVAAAATLAGAGLAWRTSRSPEPPQAIDSEFWRLEFATPDGATLHMGALRGKPLLLNFWASWCPPCVEELPLLNGFFNQNSANGWQVIGLAVDQLDPVKQFLARTPVTFPVAMAGNSGIEISRSLGNLIGGLPFTVVVSSSGQLVHRKMGKVTPNELHAWALLK
ncbi:MAG: TlpA disulfide reductase family protein [Rhodoferax sp.]|uniref:TlpA family protein disulfide reductase n=1 Tax=Rhodoferax sp. TaxID=50421 RepID=UPI00261582D7|nr:TlpA disulfide reductase family protein [Rhodoferax sp.]MDD5333714.1 TlpA disulfide reductase family protein [Rhodoferax sp.]